MKNTRQATKKYINQNQSSAKPRINASQVLSLTPDQIQEAIQQKAYELYVQRGYQNGNDAEDWLTAERMVLQDNKQFL